MVTSMPCELREHRALYLLNLLQDFEHASYQKHLQQGCDECSMELAALGETLDTWARADAAETPNPLLKEKLLNRIRQEKKDSHDAPSTQIWKNWTHQEKFPGLYTLRADQGDWESIDIEGISIKRLYADIDKRTVTMLVRMAAGTTYPSHRHAGAEECLVLEGDLHVGDSLVLHTGDYQRAGEESVHVKQWTENGCLLFIVSSTEDELLE